MISLRGAGILSSFEQRARRASRKKGIMRTVMMR